MSLAESYESVPKMGVRSSLGNALQSVGRQVGETTPPDAAPVPTPKWVVVLTSIGAACLLVAGLLVLIAGFEIWSDDDAPPVADQPSKISFTPKSPGSSNATTASAHAAGEAKGSAGINAVTAIPVESNSEETGPGDSGAPPAADGSSSDGEPGEQEAAGAFSAEYPVGEDARDGNLALALLATGAALLLGGGFAARVTSIKTPGGIEFLMAEAYQRGANDAAPAAAAVAGAAAEQGDSEILEDPEKLAELSRELQTQAVMASGAARPQVPIAVPEDLKAAARKLLDQNK